MTRTNDLPLASSKLHPAFATSVYLALALSCCPFDGVCIHFSTHSYIHIWPIRLCHKPRRPSLIVILSQADCVLRRFVPRRGAHLRRTRPWTASLVPWEIHHLANWLPNLWKGRIPESGGQCERSCCTGPCKKCRRLGTSQTWRNSRRGHGGEHRDRSGTCLPGKGLQMCHLHAQHSKSGKDRPVAHAGCRSLSCPGCRVRESREL
ncbi:unnamed protein product [Mycena citricolor]|uniref:Uncharacterized protein n=1 Tax=Mycena citricolor TaxID=2018698 RepID=A0AAD2K698_9AGAR|nr:unnamed protein product [Mycena citricolor]